MSTGTMPFCIKKLLTMRKFIIILYLLLISLCVNAQVLYRTPKETPIVKEYYNGQLWVHRQIGDIVVGMTNNLEKDDYGKYYQIAIFVKNLGEKSVTFDPDKIRAILFKKSGNQRDLQVYSYQDYIKKMKNSQTWTMAMLGLSAGLEAGKSGYSRTVATTQMMILGKLMDDERNIKTQGYLRINTLHPGEGIVGFMNVKRKEGEMMRVKIPVEELMFVYDWNLCP